jgi:hypothetical protein
MSEKFSPSEHQLPEKYVKNYQQLQEIWTVLKEAGLTPTNYPPEFVEEEWNSDSAFPLAQDGVQGIRISRSREGQLKIWFTNGFENPNNPKRIEITQKLREKGFKVV